MSPSTFPSSTKISSIPELLSMKHEYLFVGAILILINLQQILSFRQDQGQPHQNSQIQTINMIKHFFSKYITSYNIPFDNFNSHHTLVYLVSVCTYMKLYLQTMRAINIDKFKGISLASIAYYWIITAVKMVVPLAALATQCRLIMWLTLVWAIVFVGGFQMKILKGEGSGVGKWYGLYYKDEKFSVWLMIVLVIGVVAGVVVWTGYWLWENKRSSEKGVQQPLQFLLEQGFAMRLYQQVRTVLVGNQITKSQLAQSSFFSTSTHHQIYQVSASFITTLLTNVFGVSLICVPQIMLNWTLKSANGVRYRLLFWCLVGENLMFWIKLRENGSGSSQSLLPLNELIIRNSHWGPLFGQVLFVVLIIQKYVYGNGLGKIYSKEDQEGKDEKLQSSQRTVQKQPKKNKKKKKFS